MKNNLLYRIEIRPLTDEASYQAACDLIAELMDMSDQNLAGEEEEKRLAYLDKLATLVETYETRHFAFHQTIQPSV